VLFEVSLNQVGISSFFAFKTSKPILKFWF